MKWLRDLPIRRKLTLAILLTCSVVLLLACGVLAVYQMFDFRRIVVRNSTVLADVISKNTQAALAFQDENAAQKTLLALQAEPNVSAACLYTAAGNQLADYIRTGIKINFPKQISTDGHHFDHGRLLLFRPIMLNNKRIGTLYLQTDLQGMYDRLWLFGGIAFLVLLGSVLVAFMLSSRLQRPISEPILALAETARVIADHKDYSVRAVSHGRDETGLLTDAFNQMLAGIQERENALRAANEALRSEIAERQRAEDAIKRFAAIVESSDDAIIGETLDGIITSWNSSAERIFGYSIAEIIGQPMQILTPPEYAHEESEILARITKGEHIRHFETSRVRKDGRRIDVSITISPIKDAAGKIVGTSKIARDITERKQLESQLRQSQKMEAIGQLAGGVAHDFNNILAVIQMQSDLLKIGGQLSPAQMDFADEIGVAVERAAALIRQLLLFSRKEALQPRDLDLSQTITNMSKMLQRTLREDIRMEFKFAPQPLFIHADASMMDQVLMNLAVNARDAMPADGLLVIETSAVDFDDFAAAQMPRALPGSYVCLSVSDTGCGIPPEILPRIFEPFFTTKDVGKGTGLGLATIFGIVQQHQGWVNVYSEVGQGTTFRVYLPRLDAGAVQKSMQFASAPIHNGDETILIVEDDKSLRASVRKALLQQGYHVLEASTAMNALEVWKENAAEIRLVLTDLVMPGGMSGKELARRLLRENSALKIIYTSGYSSEVVGKDFPLQEGVNFLTKPFQASQLAKTIRACLDA